MKYPGFNDRLNELLDNEGFPPKNKGRIQLLAEMIGLTHRGASKWINGEACPPQKKIVSLASKFKANPDWLMSGNGDMYLPDSDSGNEKQNIVAHKIPVFNLEDVLDSNSQPLKYIICDTQTHASSFATFINTEAMSPRFPNGTTIVIDPKRLPVDGDFVLVNSHLFPTPIFRQILIVGDKTFLQAHNPKFDRLFLTDSDDVIGVMVQAILTF